MKLQARSARTLLAGIATVAALALVEVALAQTPGRIARASVTAVGVEVHGNSGAPALSADGRFLAFQSEASDLVPGDTNGDTDVFVRDRSTGAVERVSLAWNGMEARDDSACPALSADGRWVAFRSRGWNMYPGGANLGNPRWDVYLRDRQEGTTARLTVAKDGGDPNGDSGCPSISGDGRKIVFDSLASNLVAGDGNGGKDVFLFDVVRNKLRRISKSAVDGGDADRDSDAPVISGNGRFVAFTSRATNLRETGVPLPPILPGALTVFVRDLDAGVTEAASLKDHDEYPYSPQEHSWAASISDDGRYVAFVSEAWNLVLPAPLFGLNVYVRDRAAGRTILASPTELSQGTCGRGDLTFPCSRGGDVSGRISGDGRFVAVASRSMRMLPANLYHGDQIYLFDVQGRRLRRLSVEPSGWEGDSCSVEPVLSADARVLAYRSTATNLVAGDTNQRADVFAHDWQCDGAGRCRTLAACPAEPVASCTPASDTLLRLSKRPPGGVKQDQLFWRWTGDASAPSFPDPTAGASYQLCVYDQALSLDVAAPPAAACAGGVRPCWQPIGAGYKLIGARSGVTALRLSTSGRTPRILLRGAGSLLDAPYLPLKAADGLVVQLQETSTGRCWGAELPASAIRYNVSAPAQRGTARTGKLVAQSR
jgi:Tol biopolymer transport system component